jgi:hypothetical protein
MEERNREVGITGKRRGLYILGLGLKKAGS